MGREANFSELRDAIRQGQAKIAQGLKSGQMRSDREAEAVKTPRPRLDPGREVLGKKLTLTEKSALFERHKKPSFRFRMPKFRMPHIRFPKVRWPQFSLEPMRPVLMGIGAVLAVAVAVLVLFWIGKSLIGLLPSRPAAVETADQPPVATARPAPTPPVVQVPSAQPAPQPPAPATPAAPPPQTAAAVRTGDNVIVIQGITASRENELLPVRDFFARHGIATEIVRTGGNYSRLVTRDKFENPSRSGSDGYEMRMKIKAIGKQYPAETGDTKFGTTPFQDAYGLLRQ